MRCGGTGRGQRVGGRSMRTAACERDAHALLDANRSMCYGSACALVRRPVSSAGIACALGWWPAIEPATHAHIDGCRLRGRSGRHRAGTKMAARR